MSSKEFKNIHWIPNSDDDGYIHVLPFCLVPDQVRYKNIFLHRSTRICRKKTKSVSGIFFHPIKRISDYVCLPKLGNVLEYQHQRRLLCDIL